MAPLILRGWAGLFCILYIGNVPEYLHMARWMAQFFLRGYGGLLYIRYMGNLSKLLQMERWLVELILRGCSECDGECKPNGEQEQDRTRRWASA